MNSIIRLVSATKMQCVLYEVRADSSIIIQSNCWLQQLEQTVHLYDDTFVTTNLPLKAQLRDDSPTPPAVLT